MKFLSKLFIYCDSRIISGNANFLCNKIGSCFSWPNKNKQKYLSVSSSISMKRSDDAHNEITMSSEGISKKVFKLWKCNNSQNRNILQKSCTDNYIGIEEVSSLFVVNGSVEDSNVQADLSDMNRKTTDHDYVGTSSEYEKHEAINDECEQDVNFKKSKSKKYYPNYFVAVPVSNPDIHRGILKIQEKLKLSDPNLSKALIDVASLHLTLFVLHVSDEQSLFIACSAFDESMAALNDYLSSPELRLKFSGLSNFSDKVLYVNIEEDENYDRLRYATEKMSKKFCEKEIILPDKRLFKPHLTLAKLSKMRSAKKNKCKKIDPSLYEEFLTEALGCQIISKVQLLSMNKPKDLQGYYHCEREVYLDTVNGESLDHSKYCFPVSSSDLKDTSKPDCDKGF